MELDIKTLREKHPELVAQLVKESSDTVTEQAELAKAKKATADLQARLDALESERLASALKVEVTTEITKIFEGVELEAALMTEIVECACEMKDRTKLKSVLSKLSPMLVETDDEFEDDDEPITAAKEQVEETTAPRRAKSGRSSAGFDLSKELGLAAK